MNDYQFWLSQGTCPFCHHRKIAPGRHACRECLNKRNAYAKRKRGTYYGGLSEERKQAIRDREKAEYERHKALGICVRCTKPATHGVFCDEHWKKIKVSRTKHNRKIGVKPIPKRQKLEIPPQSKHCRSDVGKIIALYNAGWKYKDIVTEMRICESTVSYWVRKAKEAANADLQRSA